MRITHDIYQKNAIFACFEARYSKRAMATWQLPLDFGDPTVVLTLAATAFITSILSAIVGMAGGIVLLAVMLVFLEPLVAIPLHAVVQLVANGSRTWIQRKSVRWSIVWPYALPLVPFGFLGIYLIRDLPPDATRAAIGCFVLVATWLPGIFASANPGARLDPTHRFLALGVVVGMLNVTLGAVGPLIAPFYLSLGLNRFELIGSKAASQSLAHVAKIVVFGTVGFAFAAYVPMLALLAVCVVAGTALGSRLLGRVSERAFVIVYKVVLTVIAVRLVVHAGWTLYFSAS